MADGTIFHIGHHRQRVVVELKARLAYQMFQQRIQTHLKSRNANNEHVCAAAVTRATTLPCSSKPQYCCNMQYAQSVERESLTAAHSTQHATTDKHTAKCGEITTVPPPLYYSICLNRCLLHRTQSSLPFPYYSALSAIIYCSLSSHICVRLPCSVYRVACGVQRV